MTAVIIAFNYRDARNAAQALDLGEDWTYPTFPEKLRAMQPSRIVWVDGWARSPHLTTAALDALRAMEAPEVYYQPKPPAHVYPSPYEQVTSEPDSLAGAFSDASPFVDMNTTLPFLTPPPRARRGLPVVWDYAVVLLAAVSVSCAVYMLGRARGWW